MELCRELLNSEYFENLAKSMPERMKAVLDAE